MSTRALSFDYIIVGAGSAGCVLANRLTADAGARVLLLEAGGTDRRPEVRMPAAFNKLFRGACDWAYDTEPEPHLGGRRLYIPRGKMLGGSSSMNAMLYVRGHRLDYDRWAESGNDGWDFASVLPYFKKAEHQERGPSEYHGVGGPLNVADLRTHNPLSRVFVDAAAESGLRRNIDFNGAEQEGVGFYQVTQKKGRRHSAAAGYLTPILNRPNLTVRTDARVTRVLFEGTRATGVELAADSRRETAAAGREVILCGGAINSPQLLLLSGVGPATDLKKLGIAPVVDLPGVGQNLQDHPVATLAYECKRPITMATAESLPNLLRYLFLKNGPLTSCVAESGGFVRTNDGVPAPDLQFHFAPVYYLEHGFTRPEGHGFTLGPTLLVPESRGSLSLLSRDPFKPPAIRLNLLEHEQDRRLLIDGIRMGRQIIAGRAFDDYRGRETHPGAAVAGDSQLDEYIRGSVEAIYHPVGTCKMGTDPAAVVDSRLRVHGVQGLRVVDASIMPFIVRGNTNAPTIMVGEKAAAMILGSA